MKENEKKNIRKFIIEAFLQKITKKKNQKLKNQKSDREHLDGVNEWIKNFQ